MLVVSQPPTSHSEETSGRHFHFQTKPQLGNNFKVYISTIHYWEKS